MPVPLPTTADLAALARKYAAIVDLLTQREHLREAGLAGVPPELRPERRRRLAELAREFPMALREMERLPLAELQRRHEVLAPFGNPGRPEGQGHSNAQLCADEHWVVPTWVLHQAVKAALTPGVEATGINLATGPRGPGRAGLARTAQVLGISLPELHLRLGWHPRK